MTDTGHKDRAERIVENLRRKSERIVERNEIPAHISLKIAALELRVSELSEQLNKLHAEFHSHEHESVVQEVAA